MLDPEVTACLRMMFPEGAPPLDLLPVEAIQTVRDGIAAQAAASPFPKRPVGQVRDLSIAGPGGALPLRIYQPAGEKAPRPLVVYFHGGGWVLCGLDTHDDVCRDLCAEVNCVVVSVDYRLAPEHRFPAGADDCLAATRWAAAHAGELGADAARMALAGDSAGATLAITTALRCAAEGGLALRAIAPIYPASDLREPCMHASRQAFGTGEYGLSERDMRWFSGHYLRGPDDALHPWVSPLLSPDLGHLPPCLLATAQFDPLHDEGAALADAMAAAGVDVRYRSFDGLPHGFLNLGMAPAARRAIDDITATLAALLAEDHS